MPETINIRPAEAADLPFLWEMLFASMYTPEGEPPLSRDILARPEISKYLDDWGKEGDMAFIAVSSEGERLGSVTLRLFDPEHPGYGYVDENTPELGMAIQPEHRGKGIGTLLMQRAFEELHAAGIPSVSLSVDPRNRAVKLYERFGFTEVGMSGTSVTMKAQVHRSGIRGAEEPIHKSKAGNKNMSQSAKRLDKEITKRVKLDYLLHLPEAYESEPEKKWPLILFLHGSGERGSDVELVKVHGIPKLADQDPQFPFIAISPQCPEDSFWAMEEDALMALLEEVEDHYRVDPKRIYLTGLSMGGYGAWQLAAMYPDKWAAVVPICGGMEPKYAEQIKDIPIWAFHGAKDDVVPLSESEQIVKALEEIGGNVKFTVYPDANHDSWTETYANKELYTWLLSHSLS
ncbi:GNAT family N-acetyltransferase [Paenibacillus cineris]|uniref:N-acetyltransferase domain-containing protein n=1 Tax=Paenibacillus cineris TaxID=237530 RepID=A0ABQ4LD02_9BACL|nr:GNAT family N-acetyltransferase [Paenibacillus cineris]GIO54321.1 hypothetical protein J21TS7_26390 [Paenibacillus cineris]